MLDIRRQTEKKSFQAVPDESQFMFVINRDWLKAWLDFANSVEIGQLHFLFFHFIFYLSRLSRHFLFIEPPGPISNSAILEAPRSISGTYRIRMDISSTRYDWLSQPQWDLLFSIYGGGPKYSVRNTSYVENQALKVELNKVEAMEIVEDDQDEEEIEESKDKVEESTMDNYKDLDEERKDNKSSSFTSASVSPTSDAFVTSNNDEFLLSSPLKNALTVRDCYLVDFLIFSNSKFLREMVLLENVRLFEPS